jgi:hypothetical protein
MAELRGRVFQVVANPKQFVFAPFELAIINIILSVAVMLLCIAVIGVTPFVSMIPLILGHALLCILGARNQHLTTTLQATGKYPSSRKNLTRVNAGVKYIP